MRNSTSAIHWLVTGACFALLSLCFSVATTIADAAVPDKFSYTNRLLNGQGLAITSAHSIRFSYWYNVDAAPSDLLANGQIDPDATHYAHWQEVHTITPNSRGFFTVELGSVNAFPVFRSNTLFMQVEVKAQATAATAFEILDPKIDDPSIDRVSVLSVPFAVNAGKVDGREPGTASGNLAVLQQGGTLSNSVIPEGLKGNKFVLDTDNSATGEISLQFGGALQKKLTYELVAGLFEFNDDVRILGNLTVTGTVNGVNIEALAEAISATGSRLFQPSYQGASFKGDESSNVGQLFMNHDTTTKQNYYEWTSSRETLQDYDILLLIPIPEHGLWNPSSLQVRYQTNAALATMNKLDITVFDTTGTAVTLSGTSTDLASTSWTNATIDFTGSPVWEAGKSFLVKFTVSAKDNEKVRLGSLLLN